MYRGSRLAAISLAVAITIGMAACGSSASESTGALQDGGGSATSTCKPRPTPAGWSGIFRTCMIFGKTIELVNTSHWEVLRVRVPADAPGQSMVELFALGSGLAAQVERAEFHTPVLGGVVAVVPPGAAVLSRQVGQTPVHLLVSIDYPATTANVTAMGLTGIVLDKVKPVQSEVQAIVDCADYVRSQPRQVIQWQPTSQAFWDTFANVSVCRSALKGASEALDSSAGEIAESTAADRVASFTEDFFADVLPKIISLVAGKEL